MSPSSFIDPAQNSDHSAVTSYAATAFGTQGWRVPARQAQLCEVDRLSRQYGPGKGMTWSYPWWLRQGCSGTAPTHEGRTINAQALRAARSAPRLAVAQRTEGSRAPAAVAAQSPFPAAQPAPGHHDRQPGAPVRLPLRPAHAPVERDRPGRLRLPAVVQPGGVAPAAAIRFASLLVFYRPNGDLLDAYRAIAILFFIPTVFYVVSHTLITGQQLDPFSAAVATGYAFLPFVLMAGLAIFPLTLLENMVLAGTLLLAQGLAGYLNWPLLNWPSYAGGYWLLVLIAGVTALACMSQLAFMIALVRQAIRDPLTGILSRGSGTEILHLLWSNAEQNNGCLALAFFDIDHFKAINDTYGHEAGDRVLQAFTNGLQSRMRGSDTLLRWG